VAHNDLGISYLEKVDVIGRGGFSTVYAASDVRFSRRVAVKVLGQVIDESDQRRFDRECQIMGRLGSHPNVVTVHDAGSTPDRRPYLIMELVDGGTLADELETKGKIGWQQAVDYIIPVCHALTEAHTQGILHRDVKPENILLSNGVPKLTDFGIAYLRDSTGHSSTNITASWLHAPPETFDNARDERSDLYSVASTLYTLIAGAAPLWRAGDESLSPLIVRVLNEAPPLLPPALVPAELSDLLRRSLAKSPSERPQTVADLADALQQIRGGAPSTDDEQRTRRRPDAGTRLATEHPQANPEPVWPPPGSGTPAARPTPGPQSRPRPGNWPHSASTGPRPPVSGESTTHHQWPTAPKPQPPFEWPVPAPKPSSAPGWYRVPEAPSMQRYWDGSQWLGAPSPIAAGPATQNPNRFSFIAPQRRPTLPPAVFGERATAHLIDVGVYLAVYVLISLATTNGVAALLGGLVVFLNHVVRQGQTGRTIGKSARHLRLVSDQTAQPPGVGTALIRLIVWAAMSVFCGIAYIADVLWANWSRDQKRFTDRWLGLSVIRD